MATLARERQAVLHEIETAERAGNGEAVRRLTTQFTAMGTLLYRIAARCNLPSAEADAQQGE